MCFCTEFTPCKALKHKNKDFRPANVGAKYRILLEYLNAILSALLSFKSGRGSIKSINIIKHVQRLTPV